jgi:hypothetical protein
MTPEKKAFFAKYSNLLCREDRDAYYDDYRFEYEFLKIEPADEEEFRRTQETEVCF